MAHVKLGKSLKDAFYWDMERGDDMGRKMTRGISLPIEKGCEDFLFTVFNRSPYGDIKRYAKK